MVIPRDTWYIFTDLICDVSTECHVNTNKWVAQHERFSKLCLRDANQQLASQVRSRNDRLFLLLQGINKRLEIAAEAFLDIKSMKVLHTTAKFTACMWISKYHYQMSVNFTDNTTQRVPIN